MANSSKQDFSSLQITDVRGPAHEKNAEVKEIQSGFGVGVFSHVIGYGGGGGSWALDPNVWVDSLQRVSRQIGAIGMARFATEQTALWALSTGKKAYNPASPYLPPIARNHVPIAIDLEYPLTTIDQRPGKEEAKILANAWMPPKPSKELSKDFYYNDELTSVENPIVNIGEMIDNIIDGKSDPTTKDLVGAFGTSPVKRKTIDLSYLFRKTGGGPEQHQWKRNITQTSAKSFKGQTLSKYAFVGGIIPMEFKGDDIDGSIVTTGDTPPWSKISDNEAYVPFSFTDLRPLGGNNPDSYRTIYLRPIITSFSEDFSPQWSKDTYFGRTDQVVHYQSTIRTIAVSFQLHAFCPEDVKVIWNKIHWLASMTYPEYDSEMLLKSGPVIRMRIGDAISVGKSKLGVSGVIDSLGFDFSDSLWELKNQLKVPRSVNVSLSFNAIHDTVIGRTQDGEFGGISVRPIDKSSFMGVTPNSAGSSIQMNDPTLFRNAGIRRK